MCAHPSQKQSAGSCLSLSLRPESRAHAAQPCADPVMSRLTQIASAALEGTVIGNSTLSGRAFSVWSWLRATSEAIGQTVVGGRQCCVCLVSGVWCWQNDWLELDDRVACCGTHTHTHTHTRARTHTPHHTDPASSGCSAWGSDLSRRVCMV